MQICRGAFAHGRFHRDFNIDRARADARYDRWLAEMHAKGQVYGLQYRGELAGFAAVVGAKLVLHAVAEAHRGRGRAHFLWTTLCEALFAAGEPEISSSISVANLAALNLYAALGFRFRHPTDIYHRVIS
jgi:ribosomal protein S18 acetylase RimI-like enzyme